MAFHYTPALKKGGYTGLHLSVVPSVHPSVLPSFRNSVTLFRQRYLHNRLRMSAFDIQVNGKRGPGRPKMTWKQLTERDRREWKLSAIDPHDRDTWRSDVRSAMRAESQLPGRGPTVVDMAPIPAR